MPGLTIRTNQIVETGQFAPIRLRGINCSGLEYTPASEGACNIAEPELDEMANWGANLIRLPFNQEWALAGEDYDAEPYLSVLDTAVARAAERGMYTLLDLHWLDASSPRGHLQDGRTNFVPPLPNIKSLEVWSNLTRHYRSEPAVLYDIFNEPHDPLPDDPEKLVSISAERTLIPLRGRRVTSEVWRSWATRLILEIRSQNPDALVFVSGLDWGYDLACFPLPAIDNVVYSSHVYPNKGKKWASAFGTLSESAPVFIGELGGIEADLAWGERLLGYLDQLQVGWAAWSWRDHPKLVEPGFAYEPTPFGKLIQAALRENIRRNTDPNLAI